MFVCVCVCVCVFVCERERRCEERERVYDERVDATDFLVQNEVLDVRGEKVCLWERE